MTIGITGSSGFVGKNLKPYLASFGNLKVIEISREELINPSLNYDVIIHLAGKAHDFNNAEPHAYYKDNFELTKSLFINFIQATSSKFIFISSVKAVSDKPLQPLTENDLPDPKTHYGKSKLMAENFITRQLLPDGKTYFILRPCMIHGPGNKGNFNLLYKCVVKGIPYPLACFQNKRSFLSIDNLCYIIKEIIIRNDIPSGIYNVSDNEVFSTNELIEIIGETLSKKVCLLKIPKIIIRFVSKIGDVIKLPMNSEILKKLTNDYIVDNSKISKFLPQKLPISGKEGFIKTIQSFTDDDNVKIK